VKRPQLHVHLTYERVKQPSPLNMQHIYHGFVFLDFLLGLESPNKPSLTSSSTSSMLCFRRERAAIECLQNFPIAILVLGEAFSSISVEGELKS
jgi:hypothetical protein